MSLLGQFMVNIITGSINTYGSCGIYYVSYLRKFQPNLIYTTFLIPNTFYPIINCLCNLVSVKYGQIVGFRWALISTVLMATFGCFACYFCESWLWFQFWYGGVHGLAVGLMYLIPIYINWLALPKQKGYVSSTSTIGGNFSSILLSFLALKIVNPNNEAPSVIDPSDKNNKYFSEEITNRVPLLLLILGVIYFSIGIVGALLMYQPDKEEEMMEVEDDNASMESKDELKKKQKELEYKVFKKALWTSPIWLIFSISIFSEININFFVLYYKQLGLEYGMSDNFMTTTRNASLVGAMYFGVFWGKLCNSNSFKRLLFWCLLLITVYSYAMIFLVRNIYTYFLCNFLNSFLGTG